MSRMVLVDNAAYSYVHQLANGIPVIPFYDNKDDRQLQALTSYLLTLQDQDVLATNKKHFKMHQYFTDSDHNKVIKKIFPCRNNNLNDTLD